MERIVARRVPAQGAVLAVAGFGAFLAFLDSTVVNVAFPGIAASFPGASLSWLSWVLNAYNIAFAGFLIAGGRFADLLGRRRTFVAGTLVFTLASAGCAAATSVGMLVAFRVVQGIGCAVLVPASLALVIASFPEERVAHGITLWGATAALAAGLGPPIGGALVSIGNWRLAFVINLPLGVLAAVLAGRSLVESRAPGRRRLPDLPGTALLASGVAVLTLAVVQGRTWGWTDARTLGAEVASLALLAAFAVRNARHRSPVIDPALLRTRRFAIGNVVTIVSSAGFYAYGLTHILWLRYVWHYSLFEAGLAVAPGAFMAAVTAAVLGRVAERVGYRTVVVVGAVVWAAALYLYSAHVGLRPDFLGQWLPAQIVSGIGVGATLPIVTSAAIHGVSGGRYATASAVLSSARQFGAVVGIAILVVILGNPSGASAVGAFRDGWLFSALCFLAAALLAVLLGGRPVVDRATLDAAGPPVAEGDADAAPAAPPSDAFAQPAVARFFGSLTPHARDVLEDAMTPVTVAAGETLFVQGDAPDAMYVVRTGHLEVVIGGAVVNTLGPGDLLGELALLTGAPRSATVRARRETRLDRLAREDVDRVAALDPSLGLAVAAALATRLQQLSPPPLPSHRAHVVAVVGADEAAPCAAVAAALVAEARTLVRAVDPGEVTAQGLQRAEDDHDLVVLTARRTDPGEWPRFCEHSADRVVVVASAPAPPPGFAVPADRPCDLVLVRSAAVREELLAWHSAVEPVSTHRLSAVSRAALAPLARRLTGHAVGLVLAGGGARSLVHLGVYEELHRAGVTIDRVAGASGGAIIAGLIAMGLSPAEADAAAYEEFVRHKPMSDYGVPTRGLIRGQRAYAGLRRHMGDRLIEELPLEFHAVSVDLLRAATVDHTRGPLVDAVSASMRIPGIFPPLAHAGGVHVDGAVLDNLPVGTLAALRDGPVIAVGLGRDPATAPRASTRIPGIGDTLMRSLFLGSTQSLAGSVAAADVVLWPQASGVGFLEWHQIDVLREAGRQAARDRMPAIVAAVSRRAHERATPARPRPGGRPPLTPSGGSGSG